MAIRNIIKDGDPVLHKVCRPVEKFDEKLAQLLDDMTETLRKSGGVGLAAPQVGILRRAFIMILEEDGEVIEAVNPEIVKTSGKVRDIEGCLSGLFAFRKPFRSAMARTSGFVSSPSGNRICASCSCVRQCRT